MDPAHTFVQGKPGSRPCLGPRNCASGPEIGLPGRISARIIVRKAAKSALRPAEGRPEGRFWKFPDENPTEILPGSPISGSEALLRNIGYTVFRRHAGIGCARVLGMPRKRTNPRPGHTHTVTGELTIEAWLVIAAVGPLLRPAPVCQHLCFRLVLSCT